jgi:hypothetical protein
MYYVKRNWTFLAIEVAPKQGNDSLKLEGRLPPVRVSFPSESIVYPLKFETHQGEFPVTLHVVTPAPIVDKDLSEARHRGFYVAANPPQRCGEPKKRSSAEQGDRETGPHKDAARHDAVDLTRVFGLLGEGAVRDQISEIRERRKRMRLHNGSCGYFVNRAKVSLASARGMVFGDELKKVGAWNRNHSLYIRTLHTEALNSGLAEPDAWQTDVEIPMEVTNSLARGRRVAAGFAEGVVGVAEDKVERQKRTVSSSKRGLADAMNHAQRESSRAHERSRQKFVFRLLVGGGVLTSLVVGVVFMRKFRGSG